MELLTCIKIAVSVVIVVASNIIVVVIQIDVGTLVKAVITV